MTTYTIKSYEENNCQSINGTGDPEGGSIPEFNSEDILGTSPEISNLKNYQGDLLSDLLLNPAYISVTSSPSYKYYLGGEGSEPEDRIPLTFFNLNTCTTFEFDGTNVYFKITSNSTPSPDPSSASSSSGLSDEEVAGVIIGSIAAAILLYVLYIKYFTSN